MNIRPTAGIESDDAYLNAKEKFYEFMRAADRLTPEQRDCLARELAAATGLKMVFEEFLRYK